MSRVGRQAALMRQDGYVTAAEVSRATGRDLTTIHKEISSGKIPGGRFGGWNWYIDIHGYIDRARTEGLFPKGSTVMQNLMKLRMLVAKRATEKRKEA